MLVRTPQLVAVADQDMLAVWRQRRAMRLSEGGVLHDGRDLPGSGIHHRNPVGTEAGHEYPPPIAGEDRLEGAIRERHRARESWFPGIAEIEQHQLVR